MTKRVLLIHQSRYGQPETTVELEDDDAKKVVDSGIGELAAEQVVYNHEDEMPDEVKVEAYRQRAAADAAGDYRSVAARTQATAAGKKGAAKA